MGEKHTRENPHESKRPLTIMRRKYENKEKWTVQIVRSEA